LEKNSAAERRASRCASAPGEGGGGGGFAGEGDEAGAASGQVFGEEFGGDGARAHSVPVSCGSLAAAAVLSSLRRLLSVVMRPAERAARRPARTDP